MDKQQIKDLALANGFKLKEQNDGEMDLNPYVYDFANALIAKANERVEELEQEVKSGIFEAACFDLDVITCLTKIAYEHNADDIPRYREKAKRCAERISKRTSDLNKFALEQKIEALQELLKRKSHKNVHNLIEIVIDSYKNQLRKEQRDG